MAQHLALSQLLLLMIMLGCLLIATAAAASTKPPSFPFWNPSLPWDTRVRDLLGRLTDDELVEQLAKGGAGVNGGPAPAVPRLGIRPYVWDTECLAGYGMAGPATSFPQAIGLAATFSPEIISVMSRATGLEVRATFNDYAAHGNYTDHHGLTCFSPVVNLMRHPFWGRNQETYGEDPYLTGVLAAGYVRGIQGDLATERFALAGAGCKHFAAHNGPENFPVPRVSFNAIVPDQDLRQSYLPQFRRCLAAGTFSVMCSYNAVNGVPACANHRLLTDILRGEWNFTGYVVSDQGALEFAVDFHKYFANKTEAAVGALAAGVNLELSPDGCPDQACVVFEHLHEAVASGRVTRGQLLERAYPLFYTRMRLGEFDPPETNPYSSLRAADIVQTPRQRRLSSALAAASFVLLKNEADFLPLLPSFKGKRVDLIGPFADNMTLMYGEYAADRMPEFEVPMAEGLRRLGANVTVWRYCLDGVLCSQRNESALRAAIAEPGDLIIAALGTGQLIETENVDRRNLSLPDGQDRLARILASLGDGGKPTVMLLFTGGPVDIGAAAAPGSGVRAILWCGFPAQEVGVAVASVLSGEMSPFARLPFTWYAPGAPLDSITNYVITNTTYRFIDPSGPLKPLYWFGYGLPFAQCRVRLTDLAATPKLRPDDNLDVAFTASVVSGGGVGGGGGCIHTAKVLLRPVRRVGRNPRIWLAAVRLVTFTASGDSSGDGGRGGGGGGISQRVYVRVLAEDMQQWNQEAGRLEVLPGDYDLVVGDYFDESCADCRLVRRFVIQQG